MREPVTTRSPGVVLVVEDNPLVQITAMAVIEDAGMQTLAAADADDALQILETRGDIRTVFTDVDMPGTMDGLALARLIRARWPDIRLVVTSGGIAPDKIALPGSIVYLQKPYDYASIVQTLQRVVA